MMRARRMLAAVATTMGLAIGAFDGATPVSADVQAFVFDSLDVDYTLSRADDGTSRLRVVETFVAVFPETDQNHGMQRRLPDTAFGQPLRPALESVTDENGDPRPAETDTDDGELIVTSAADDFVHGRQTYVFTYTLHNVTPLFAGSGTEEFYWNVNGLDWAQPFGRVTARLHVPADLVPALTEERRCYRGDAGETTPCTLFQTTAEADGTATITADASALGPRESVTIAVGFTPGTFSQFDASYFASPWGWAQTGAAVAVVAAVVLALVVRRRRLADAPGRPTVIAEYDPPRDVDALESAVLLGRSTKAIPAEVLEQAVIGSIRIVEGAKPRWGRAPLEAHLLDPELADGDGRMLLDGLFGDAAAPGEVFVFGRQDARLSKVAQAILGQARQDLIAKGMWRAVPTAVRAAPMALVIVATVAAVGFGAAALGADVVPWAPIALAVLAVLLGATGVGLLAHRPLSPIGAETRDHLAGLRIFIEWAEADRIRMLQSPQGAERTPVDAGDAGQVLRLYERLLPYAVVFGQEKQWAERLAVLYPDGTAPTWYAGTAGFSAASFASGIGSLSVSATSASGSGGSTGGGSAGGGGGGGGGGGV
ncbi:DUF2207 family protein [Microbacterium sp. NPDC091313]